MHIWMRWQQLCLSGRGPWRFSVFQEARTRGPDERIRCLATGNGTRDPGSGTRASLAASELSRKGSGASGIP